MGIKDKIIKSQLKKLGIDISHPKQVTFKTLNDLIESSIPSIISEREMIKFLQEKINELES